MKNIRNYLVTLMDGSSYNVTEEEANIIEKTWSQNGVINIDNTRFPSHQITGIKKDNTLGEDDALQHYGVSLTEALRNQKQLEKKYNNLLDNKSM